MPSTIFTLASSAGSLVITGSGANTLDIPTVNNAISNNLTHSVLTSIWGGGATSNVFTITGLPATAVGVCQIVSQANTAAIVASRVAAGTLTVYFSADPGAGTQVSFLYTNQAQ
jgi:hypothetical protein